MKKIKRIINKLVNSPTFMTWFSFSAKSLSVLVVLPLILSKFSTTEISLWFLFSILFGFQIIADLGFGSTFTRLISYAMAGLKNLEDIGIEKYNIGSHKSPNWNLIIALNKKMKTIFLFISVIFVFLMALISFFFLDAPIENLENPNHGYYLLILILVVLFFKIYSRRYISFISGTNEVALLRRWEGIIVYFQIISSIIILILTENFYYLVITNQFWVLVGIVNTYLLQKRILNKNLNPILNEIEPVFIEKKGFINHVFNPSWKSGIGTLSSYGLNQFSSLVLVDYLLEDDLVIFLLSLKFINIISEFSRAPFYANLPTFAQKFQLLDTGKLLSVIKKSIDSSIFLTTICLLFVLFLGNYSFKLIGSNVNSIDYLLWFLFSLNLLFERLGAMHFQIHSLSNKVVWHKANLIYGLIFILVSIFTIKLLGLYAIPFAMLAGNLLYYTPIALKTTFKYYSYKFYKFNHNIIICLVVLIILNLIILIS